MKNFKKKIMLFSNKWIFFSKMAQLQGEKTKNNRIWGVS